MKNNIKKYIGISYPNRPRRTAKDYSNWAKKHCPKHEHLFDEYWDGQEHYLICDACGFVVHIAGFETLKEICKRYKKDKPTPFIISKRETK